MFIWSYLHFFCFLCFLFSAAFSIYRNRSEPLYWSMFLVQSSMALWSLSKVVLHHPYAPKGVAEIFSGLEFTGAHLTVLFVPWYFYFQSRHPRRAVVVLVHSLFVAIFLFLMGAFWLVEFMNPAAIVKTSYGWQQTFFNSPTMIPLIPFYAIGFGLPLYYLFYFFRTFSKKKNRYPIRLFFILLTFVFGSGMFFTFVLPTLGIPDFPDLSDVVAVSFAFAFPAMTRRYSLQLEPIAAAESVVESLPDPLLIADSEGRIVRMNGSARRLFGNVETVDGRKSFELFPSGGVDVPSGLADLLPVRYESHFKSREGQAVDYTVVTSPVLDISGICSGSISVAYNVSERVRLENRLRAQTDVLAHSNSELDTNKKVLSATLDKSEKLMKSISDDMDAARRMQKLLLPSNLSSIPGLRLSALFRPSQSIGGDLFDVRKISENTLSIVVFDVAGHGVAAALYAAVAKTVFERQVSTAVSPGETLRRVNADLVDALGGELFLAAFLAHLNIETLMLTYALAAFPYPYLFRKSTGEAMPLVGKGAFVGMLPDDDIMTAYEDNCVFMEHGDRLLVCSDGLSEARNGEGIPWGSERLRQSFIEGVTLPLPVAAEKVVAAQESFCAPTVAQDDRTLFMVEMI